MDRKQPKYDVNHRTGATEGGIPFHEVNVTEDGKPVQDGQGSIAWVAIHCPGETYEATVANQDSIVDAIRQTAAEHGGRLLIEGLPGITDDDLRAAYVALDVTHRHWTQAEMLKAMRAAFERAEQAKQN
jgi:hypothetical protein